MEFSLFYFDAKDSLTQTDKYQLLIESAKFADQNGFSAIWIPERHFHEFGGLYPNPSLVSAALAMVTKRIQLRAGSVVLPLHHPALVVEEWSVVDHLSNGRVAMSFAPGWTVDDFILSQNSHANRKATMWSNIQKVRRLWQGEQVDFQDATGKNIKVRTFPTPLQRQLPMWITAQSSETFVEAGKLGTSVLTSLLYETIETIEKKIQLYRESLANHGHNPQAGKVALMVHTFLGADNKVVQEQVKGPLCNYLKVHLDLLENLCKGMGLQLSLKDFSEDDIDSLLLFSIQGFLKGRSLVGTPATCRPIIDRMSQAGVNEVACLIDFNPDFESVMSGLLYLKELKDSYSTKTDAALFS